MTDLLQRVRNVQHSNRDEAEKLLLSFIKENFPLEVVSLELTPLAVSLNSFNGFLTLKDGKRLFFKTHTETDTVINEYYNAELLLDAGYPVIQPVFKSTEPGKQFLAYEVIEDQSVFDIAWAIENNRAAPATIDVLTAAQQQADQNLFSIYRQTADLQPESPADSPIHQLFYHRLTGGRLERFYGLLPGEKPSHTVSVAGHTMAAIRQVRWVINGQVYFDTLDDIISRAIELLNPEKTDVTIIGHGDAHNGNVFFRTQTNPPSLLYFDPAFAGRHHPLMDLVKPLFHNVFAMWMYFPEAKHQKTSVNLMIQDNTWHIRHSYILHPVRKMFWESKVQHTLLPVLQWLKSQNALRADWRAYLKAALFCCPFLTMNLADAARFPAEISLLGLAMAVEMGAESQGEYSLLDQTLDMFESSL